MSSSCLISGGGRACKLNLNHELIKPSPNSNSNSSSSSSQYSSLSESNNSISTRKSRTPRKRPNQTYNEAAASILSTAYPKLFPTKHLTKPCRFTKKASALLTPSEFIDNSGYLLPDFPIEPPENLNLFEKEKPSSCQSPEEIINSSEKVCDDEYREDFDAESILDEEIEEGGIGIDSIFMGDLSTGNENTDDSNDYRGMQLSKFGLLGFDFGYGMRNELRAMRNVEEGDDWWRFPSVNVADITQKIDEIPVDSTASSEEAFRQTGGGLLLKLNYDDVLSAWSDKGSPFSGNGPAAESTGDDVQARLS